MLDEPEITFFRHILRGENPFKVVRRVRHIQLWKLRKRKMRIASTPRRS